MTELVNSNLLKPVSSKSGIGLRHFHYKDIAQHKPDIGFLEIHPENYFGGGIELHILENLNQIYSLSFHSVSLSLGSSQRVSTQQLKRIKILIDRFKPIYVSDHASWSAFGNAHLNDLLPLVYNKKSLLNFCDNINSTQDYFGRQIFIENPSTYLQFNSEMTEAEFLMEMTYKTDCRLLLDVNNIFVNSINHRMNPIEYINLIDKKFIGEVHLAGHAITNIAGIEKRIDTHDDFVCDEVWSLYRHLTKTKGNFPTLIEWDDKFPTLDDLVNEAKKSDSIMNINKRKDVA